MKKIFILIFLIFTILSSSCVYVVGGNGTNNGNNNHNNENNNNSNEGVDTSIIPEELLSYPVITQLQYTDYGTLNKDNQHIIQYNKDKWYYNELKQIPLPDPFVYSENGVYYITGTNDRTICNTIDIYMTTDFVNYSRYEAYVPMADWEKKGEDARIFAPEIFKHDGYYYLTYSNIAEKDNIRYITFVKSDSLMGPFEIIQEYNSLGEYIDGNVAPLFSYNERYQVEALDQHIYQEDGKMYMYYAVLDLNETEHIVGVEMIDPITADWSTYKVLIKPGHSSPYFNDNFFYWESFTDYPPCVEAPYIIKGDNGKYYLTYSANHYPNRYYTVCYAVADSPLGNYKKPYIKGEEWSNLLLGYGGPKTGDIYDDWGGFMSGCGHHSFFKVGDELMIAYHAHSNHGVEINNGWMARSAAFDYVYYDDEGNLYTNGPTYSLQPLPEAITGYKNIALNAKVKYLNVNNAQNVNDNYIVSNHNLASRYNDREVELRKGYSYILLEFDKDYSIGGINIYNSSKYEKMVYEIKFINFFNDNVVFNSIFPECYYSKEKQFVFPNSAFTIEFDDIVTNKVLICFKLEDEAQINEIEVYGKNIS